MTDKVKSIITIMLIISTLSGGVLKIINASGEIHKLFLTLKLDTVFSIHKA